MNKIKQIKLHKPRFGWKPKALAILLVLLLIGGLINAGFVALSKWDDTNDFVSQRFMELKIQAPFKIQERKPEVIEKVTREIVTTEDEKYVFVRVSHYWPPLGGTNCANFASGECQSKMANGQRWQEWVGVAIACPPEFEFGTKLKIKGRVWECKDRGSAIQTDGDLFWVDMLTIEPLVDYGAIVKAEIIE